MAEESVQGTNRGLGLRKSKIVNPIKESIGNNGW
jgi:hypothetical protein